MTLAGRRVFGYLPEQMTATIALSIVHVTAARGRLDCAGPAETGMPAVEDRRVRSGSDRACGH